MGQVHVAERNFTLHVEFSYITLHLECCNMLSEKWKAECSNTFHDMWNAECSNTRHVDG
jgi:hypothetical protein